MDYLASKILSLILRSKSHLFLIPVLSSTWLVHSEISCFLPSQFSRIHSSSSSQLQCCSCLGSIHADCVFHPSAALNWVSHLVVLLFLALLRVAVIQLVNAERSWWTTCKSVRFVPVARKSAKKVDIISFCYFFLLILALDENFSERNYFSSFFHVPKNPNHLDFLFVTYINLFQTCFIFSFRSLRICPPCLVSVSISIAQPLLLSPVYSLPYSDFNSNWYPHSLSLPPCMTSTSPNSPSCCCIFQSSLSSCLLPLILSLSPLPLNSQYFPLLHSFTPYFFTSSCRVAQVCSYECSPIQ